MEATVHELRLSLACWDYDRTRGIRDGTVRPDGLEINFIPLRVEETFWRMLRHQASDRRTPCRYGWSSTPVRP